MTTAEFYDKIDVEKLPDLAFRVRGLLDPPTETGKRRLRDKGE